MIWFDILDNTDTSPRASTMSYENFQARVLSFLRDQLDLTKLLSMLPEDTLLRVSIHHQSLDLLAFSIKEVGYAYARGANYPYSRSGPFWKNPRFQWIREHKQTHLQDKAACLFLAYAPAEGLSTRLVPIEAYGGNSVARYSAARLVARYDLTKLQRQLLCEG